MPYAGNPQHPNAPDLLLEKAERQMYAAIALSPQTPDSLHLLATVAHRAGLHDIATELLHRILNLDPAHAAALHTLGSLQRDQGEYAAAVDSFARALALGPPHHTAQTHADLAEIHRRLGQLNDAHHHSTTAMTLEPHNTAGHIALGNTLYHTGDFDNAAATLEHTLTLDLRHALAHRNLALLHFLRGNFSAGFDHYEHRWQLPGFRGTLEQLQRPLWTGEPLGDRTLLLHAEQGLGDTIQFIRYLPLIAKQNGRIVVQGQAPLKRLLSTLPPIDQFLVRGEPLPSFDCHLPLLSLPRVFNTTLATIPHNVPYLHADPDAVESWSARLRRNSGELHVGLAWSGNPRHSGDVYRSIPFPLLAPLFALPNMRLYRLHTPAVTETPFPPTTNLSDFTAEFQDLADTAALIASLDLIISVDTVIAHLAGTLARPTWTLLPFAPDWRWLLDRPDSPWYPTMRLFRQPRLADWPAVIDAVAQELRSFPPPR